MSRRVIEDNLLLKGRFENAAAVRRGKGRSPIRLLGNVSVVVWLSRQIVSAQIAQRFGRDGLIEPSPDDLGYSGHSLSSAKAGASATAPP